MAKDYKKCDLQNLPACAVEFIKLVIRKMLYRKKVQADVRAELADHFEDGLSDCKSDEEKEQKAKQLIEQFGDVKLLAVLLRRAKKRCRPLWRTIVARTFQTVGVLILCFIIYVVWFLTGKPVVTVDYVAQINRMVRPVADERLNAAPLYQKAADLIEELPYETKELLSKKYKEVTSEEKQLIEKWLNENEEIFELVITGSKKPYYWQKYEEGVEGMWSILMPHLREFRRLSYAFRLRAHLRAEQGRYEDAFDDMKACYRLGRHLRGDKSLVEQLVGTAIEAMAAQTIRDILSEHEVDADILATLQKDFEEVIADEEFTVSFKFERLGIYDEIQRCFTEDRLGGGHLYIPRIRGFGSWEEDKEPEHSYAIIIYALISSISSPDQWPDAAGGAYKLLYTLFAHPNKRQTREMVDRLYDYWNGMAEKTPAQIQAENIDIEKQVMEMIKGNLLLEILTPALGQVCEITYRNKIEVEATLTLIAILRYKQDTGSCPEKLQELVTAGYLKGLPIDPFSDRPLVYRRTDDGFLLYSFGRNLEDDGGQVVRDERGGIEMWADKGDWVFWPVGK